MSEKLKRTLLYILLGFLIVIAFPLLVPLLIGSGITSWINKNQFKQRYQAFLDACDELVFFCYSDRWQRQDFIESHILPNLDPDIQIIYVEGRDPHSDFDPRSISYMLDHVLHKRCPNLMRITNGHINDVSLHKEMKETTEDNAAAFVQIVHEKLAEL